MYWARRNRVRLDILPSIFFSAKIQSSTCLSFLHALFRFDRRCSLFVVVVVVAIIWLTVCAPPPIIFWPCVIQPTTTIILFVSNHIAKKQPPISFIVI